MEVSNNTSSYNTYSQTSQNKSNNSFSQYLNSQDSETKNKQGKKEDSFYSSTPKESNPYEQVINQEKHIPRNAKGQNFIEALDERNPTAFKDFGISAEDEILFRQILEDSDMSESEIKKLDYSQAKQLHSFFLSNLDFDMPIASMEGKVGHILGSTSFSNNETFNKTMHKTMRETNMPFIEVLDMYNEVEINLSQFYNNEKLQDSFTVGYFHGDYFFEKDKMNINYDDFLVQILDFLDEELSKPQPSQKVVEQYQLRKDTYSEIQENYNYFKNKD